MAKSKRKTIESPSSSSTPSKKIKTKTKTPTSNKRKATVDSEEKPSSKSPKIKHNDTSDDTITNTRSNRKVNSSKNTKDDYDDDDVVDAFANKRNTPKKEIVASTGRKKAITPKANDDNSNGRAINSRAIKQNIVVSSVKSISINRSSNVIFDDSKGLSPSHVLNQKVTLWEHYSGAIVLAYYYLSPAFIFGLFYYYLLTNLIDDNEKKKGFALSGLVHTATFITTMAVDAIA
jgi:hypothetical protein